MIRRVLASCVLTACFAGVALANHQATFVLRNGDRVSGELSYKGGSAYTLNGRDYPSDDIAVIEFVPGDPSADELRRIPTVDNNPREHERHVFVTRSGEVIFGKIYDISRDGNTFTYDRRGGGRLNIASDDIARVYVNPAGARSIFAGILNAAPANTVPVNSAVSTSGAGVSITVVANRPWTDTGIAVRQGDRLTFSSSGQIRVAAGSAPEAVATVDGAGAFQGAHGGYPVPSAPVGALIGRIGNSAAFGIGSQGVITAPASGRLYLGVNDDVFTDNSGAFSVVVGR